MGSSVLTPLPMGQDLVIGGEGKASTYQLPPWIYPPAEFWPIDQVNYVPLPAIGASTPVVSFQVPPGHNGIILLYGNNFVGGGWTEGSGTTVWQISRDNAAIDGYDNIVASLGSPGNPVRHPSGFRIFENQVISLVVYNVAVVLAGQVSGGRLAGWYYPKEYEDQNITTM
jgi:hypothetical protein